MANNDGFIIEGWDEFVERFADLVDKWEDKKAELLNKIGNIYKAEIMSNVPVDTSRLVDSITVFGEGIPQDYIEVGTNVEYALFVNDGHIQHRRFLPVNKLSVGGKAKYLKDIVSKDGKTTIKNTKGIMLKEKYIEGTFFMEKGMQSAKPRLERLIHSFMVQTAREVEGGRR